jgi:hypothetical protein
MPKLMGTESVDYLNEFTGEITSHNNIANIKNDINLLSSDGIILTNDLKVLADTQPTISLNYGTTSNQPIKGDHKHNVSSLSNGVLNINLIPSTIYNTLYIVDTIVDRNLLINNPAISNGDLIKVKNLPSGPIDMFVVVDKTKLDQDAGYKEFTTGVASSINWNNISDKPDYITDDQIFNSKVQAVIPDHTGDVIGNTNLTIKNKKKLISSDNTILFLDHDNNQADIYVISENTPDIKLKIGTTADSVCSYNDPRLSDKRTPLPHNHLSADLISGGSVPLFTSADRIKLSGIESGANRYIHSEHPHTGDATMASDNSLLINPNVINSDMISNNTISGDKFIKDSVDGIDLNRFKTQNNYKKLVYNNDNGQLGLLGGQLNKILNTDANGYIRLSSADDIFPKQEMFIFEPEVFTYINRPEEDSPVFKEGFKTTSDIFTHTELGVVSVPAGLYKFTVEFAHIRIYSCSNGNVSTRFKIVDGGTVKYLLSDNNYTSASLIYYFENPGKISFNYSTYVAGAASSAYAFGESISNQSNVMIKKRIYFSGEKIGEPFPFVNYQNEYGNMGFFGFGGNTVLINNSIEKINNISLPLVGANSISSLTTSTLSNRKGFSSFSSGNNGYGLSIGNGVYGSSTASYSDNLNYITGDYFNSFTQADSSYSICNGYFSNRSGNSGVIVGGINAISSPIYMGDATDPIGYTFTQTGSSSIYYFKTFPFTQLNKSISSLSSTLSRTSSSSNAENNKGCIIGGRSGTSNLTSGGTLISTISRSTINIENPSASSIADLSSVREWTSATSNGTNNRCMVLGGKNASTTVKTREYFDIHLDTVVVTQIPSLSQERSDIGTISNGVGNKALSSGGYSGTGATYLKIIESFDLSNPNGQVSLYGNLNTARSQTINFGDV